MTRNPNRNKQRRQKRMGIKDKFKIGPQELADGAKQLQNYMQSVSVSLTKIEQALNHNTSQFSEYLQGIAKELEQQGKDLEKIRAKLGIQEGEDGTAG